MSTTPSALPDLLDALQAALVARDGLTGVTILSGPAGDGDLSLEYITLGLLNPQITTTQVYAGMGNHYKKEDIRIPCELRASSPGKGEAQIRAARTRAYGMLAEVEDLLRVTYTVGLAKIDVAQLANILTQQGVDDKGRLCVIQFDIEARTSLIS